MLYSVPAERTSCKPKPFSSDSITTFQICSKLLAAAGCQVCHSCFCIPSGVGGTHRSEEMKPRCPIWFCPGAFVRTSAWAGWLLEHGAHSPWFPMDTHAPPAAVLHLQPAGQGCRPLVTAGTGKPGLGRAGAGSLHIPGWQWQG